MQSPKIHSKKPSNKGNHTTSNAAPPHTTISHPQSSLTSDDGWYTYTPLLDLNTLFLLAVTPRPARASQSFSRHVVVACRRSRRPRQLAPDAELDASTPLVSMACVGVSPSPQNTPTPQRAPRRARSNNNNVHPYARPEQPVKRRALSLTLGLNLNFTMPVSEADEDMCAGSWSAPPKLTSSISTASLENYPLRPSVSCPSASTSYSSSTSSWPSSSTSFSSASSAPSSFSNCEQYPSSPSGSRDYDPPPPSGAPIWAGDPALAPYLSSQPSFSSLTSNIAIGDLAFAEDAAGLVREGITHVVSVVGERVHVPDFIPPSNRLHIPLPDAPFAELVGELEPVVEWVKAALVEGGVVLSQESAQQQVTPQTVHILIHCAHGISRSPAIGAALLVALPLVSDDNNVPSTLSAAAALEYVRARRPAADVNWGFRAQLVEWEGMCRDRGV